MGDKVYVYRAFSAASLIKMKEYNKEAKDFRSQIRHSLLVMLELEVD